MGFFAGKCVVITGSSGVLGAHFVHLFKDAGADIVAIDGPHGTPADDEVPHIPTLSVDIGTPSGRDTAMSFVREHAAPDILINCAGIANLKRASETQDDEFDSVMAVNVTGAFSLSRSIAAIMIDHGKPGSIINIGSVLSTRSLPGSLAYSVSKAALDQLTRSMALEYGKHGIRVNAIAAGWFASDMSNRILAGPAGALLRQRNPLRRFASVEDFDGPVMLLAGDSGSYITGAVIAVDGGQSLA